MYLGAEAPDYPSSAAFYASVVRSPQHNEVLEIPAGVKWIGAWQLIHRSESCAVVRQKREWGPEGAG